MLVEKSSNSGDFQQIVKLIETARSRAFSLVNAKLAALYYNIGKIVSE